MDFINYTCNKTSNNGTKILKKNVKQKFTYLFLKIQISKCTVIRKTIEVLINVNGAICIDQLVFFWKKTTEYKNTDFPAALLVFILLSQILATRKRNCILPTIIPFCLTPTEHRALKS